jgi:DNA polymerase III subunit gamma/tau
MEKIKHKVLALKYRPKNFDELIGQKIMAETITNSIKLNKIPNAYLFTGIRGVGKTTTARIVAKSLNCKNGIENLCNDDLCEHCESITNSNHLDVLEMDAASRTGIDDVRELIESSKYNPTSAKYKIIILDEVHMLSKQAFNGLLKTLEEPPPHLKFIFATTEIKKIPVTIVSRCQRFDLHRVSVKELKENLEKILNIENGKITEKGLILIAKAAEGSVRDSLSLLDRALVSQNFDKKVIDENFIRTMLGLADRTKIINLLNFIFQGNQTKSLEYLKEMINEGIEPIHFLNDLLEILYFLQQNKNIGELDTDISISESEQELISKISKEIKTSTLIVFWQLILKTLDELLIVSNSILSLEMLIVRLIHVKDMPSYEQILNSLNENNSAYEVQNTEKIENLENEKKIFKTNKNEITNMSKDQIKNTIQTKTILPSLNANKLLNNKPNARISSIEDLISLTSERKEIKLKYELERLNLIKFSEGKISISFNENIDKNFVRNLSEKLFEWTGSRWLITLEKKEGEKTILEKRDIEKKETFEREKEGQIYTKFKNIFPDGELIEVKKKD